MTPARSLPGDKNNKLTVLRSYRKDGREWVDCQCDCGKSTAPIRAVDFRRGRTKSCGCLRSETTKLRNKTGQRTWEEKAKSRKREIVKLHDHIDKLVAENYDLHRALFKIGQIAQSQSVAKVVCTALGLRALAEKENEEP